MTVWLAGLLLSCTVLFSETTVATEDAAPGSDDDASVASLDAGEGDLTPIILYRFEMDGADETIVRDVSGNGEPHDLSIADLSTVQWSPTRGLRLVDATEITSDVSPSKLNLACIASNALSVELWVKPANLSQKSPARMVSLGQNATSTPSFMIGQGTPKTTSDHFEIRLDHSIVQPPLDSYGERAVTPEQSLTMDWTHFVFTRPADGSHAAYINGDLVSLTGLDGPGFPTLGTPGYDGTLDVWSGDHKLALGNEVLGDRPWLGQFYLVAIYCEALTMEQVSFLFTSDTPP